MSKSKSTYSCSQCGGQTLKWQGQCPHCHEWNTLVEVISEKIRSRFTPVPETGEVQNLGEVDAGEEQRYSTCIAEFDRVLGGGLVHGSVVLLGGDPGIGKSTLLLQALCHMSNGSNGPNGSTRSQGASRSGSAAPSGPGRAGMTYPGGTFGTPGVLGVLYVSGEESARQVALRAQRLALDARAVHLLAEIRLERIQAVLLERKPAVVVIDSIQTVYSDALQSAPGSVAQVRECAAQLTRLAKASGIAIVLVGHVTKEGALAGPRVQEHMVDTVLYFEGDTHSSFRLVRAVKNRFGAVNELGVFAMGEKGLREVSNPSALFLSHHGGQVAGSCIMVTQEGTRPLLVEIQALVDEAHAPNARRLSVGLEQNRLAMLLAVLHRHAGIACFDQDVFVNAVGGVKVTEPGADLAVLLAIVSSLRNKPLPEKMVVFGEVGLAGEVRPVQRGQERLKEAAKLGFVQAIVPRANKPKQPLPGLEVIAVERVDDAVAGIR
jgi:DNA repair protein RadA/Sms